MRSVPAYILLSLSAAYVAHSASMGAIAGTAFDSEGRPVRGGQIDLVAPASGPKLSRTLTGSGSYVFDDVPAGLYYLFARVPGYYPVASRTVTVKAGDAIPLDLAFQRERSWWSEVSGVGLALWGLCASLLVAIFGPRLHYFFTRPRLALEIRPESPYAHWIEPHFTEPADVAGQASQHRPAGFKPIGIYFSRVIVRNDGSTEAERVEVSIRRSVQGEREGELGCFRKVRAAKFMMVEHVGYREGRRRRSRGIPNSRQRPDFGGR
jgi:hypothetical protein